MRNDTGRHPIKNINFFFILLDSLKTLPQKQFFYDNLEPAGWTNKI